MTSKVMEALENLKAAVREAILTEQAELTVVPYKYYDGSYFAILKVVFGSISIDMAVADTFVCIHNDLLRGMFDNNADQRSLVALCERRLLTREEVERIKELEQEIEDIKSRRA